MNKILALAAFGMIACAPSQLKPTITPAVKLCSEVPLEHNQGHLLGAVENASLTCYLYVFQHDEETLCAEAMCRPRANCERPLESLGIKCSKSDPKEQTESIKAEAPDPKLDEGWEEDV